MATTKRKVPRSAAMSQAEFEKFLDNLDLWGFDLNADKIDAQYDTIFGMYVDEMEDALSELIFVDSIYSDLRDLIGGFREKSVFFGGKEITKANYPEYKPTIENIIEERYAFIDQSLLNLKRIADLA